MCKAANAFPSAAQCLLSTTHYFLVLASLGGGLMNWEHWMTDWTGHTLQMCGAEGITHDVFLCVKVGDDSLFVRDELFYCEKDPDLLRLTRV